MDRESFFEQAKHWGFILVATIGWLVLSVFAFMFFFGLVGVIWAIQSIFSQLIGLFGFHEEVNFFRGLCKPTKRLLFKLLDAAKVRRPAGFVLERDLSPFLVLRVVWWEFAKPNRITFMAGCLVPLLAGIIWVDSPYSPWSDHDPSHYQHYQMTGLGED